MKGRWTRSGLPAGLVMMGYPPLAGRPRISLRAALAALPRPRSIVVEPEMTIDEALDAPEEMG